ncbi:hypothetical protein APR04_002974 [Promicromonospora umidemergens]|uniref:Uncharacterized protein n=1 Tax=Promicromonospora umidemergens TaxID=629679 RepID=A0ABP8WIZ2_9MICO|nr:hypothetical protein [Promicromonospora umidemergens]MCP2284054.1 hypothetical protein [Promicromonospora umidemergens]
MSYSTEWTGPDRDLGRIEIPGVPAPAPAPAPTPRPVRRPAPREEPAQDLRERRRCRICRTREDGTAASGDDAEFVCEECTATQQRPAIGGLDQWRILTEALVVVLLGALAFLPSLQGPGGAPSVLESTVPAVGALVELTVQGVGELVADGLGGVVELLQVLALLVVVLTVAAEPTVARARRLAGSAAKSLAGPSDDLRLLRQRAGVQACLGVAISLAAILVVVGAALAQQPGWVVHVGLGLIMIVWVEGETIRLFRAVRSTSELLGAAKSSEDEEGLALRTVRRGTAGGRMGRTTVRAAVLTAFVALLVPIMVGLFPSVPLTTGKSLQFVIAASSWALGAVLVARIPTHVRLGDSIGAALAVPASILLFLCGELTLASAMSAATWAPAALIVLQVLLTVISVAALYSGAFGRGPLRRFGEIGIRLGEERVARLRGAREAAAPATAR